jgi:DNA polymerase III alpha subunit
LEFDFEAGVNPVAEFFVENPNLLREPTRRERLEAETELFGYAVSGHPLELFADVAWNTYCPVSQLGEHIGETVVSCGLVVEQRTHHQITGEPMKFLTLADWTGIVETELFAQTYKNYGLATVRYPVLEVVATVEPFENGRGFSLRVLRAGKPRLAIETPDKLAHMAHGKNGCPMRTFTACLPRDAHKVERCAAVNPRLDCRW